MKVRWEGELVQGGVNGEGLGKRADQQVEK